jgi:hypothetical protein
VIWCTPKLHYPFDKNGDFHFPTIYKAYYYEKLDGTNILAYHYEYQGRDFVTFKTRLTPVVADGKFGGFNLMLKEYMASNLWVVAIINRNPDYNLSFELYGYRNPITVKYTIPLEMNLLFGVHSQKHIVVPPINNWEAKFQICEEDKVKMPKSFFAVSGEGFKENYNNFRATMSDLNKGDGQNAVIEGMVLYALTDEGYKMFKIKPEEIEKIHWATGGIPANALFTTAVNAFEAGDATIETFMELLKEEYTDQQVGRSEQRIKKIFAEARHHVETVKEVNLVWAIAKQAGFDVTKDRNGTMRFMSEHFPKEKMQRVGSIILKQAGLI